MNDENDHSLKPFDSSFINVCMYTGGYNKWPIRVLRQQETGDWLNELRERERERVPMSH